MELSVNTFVSLHGVMQGPGAAAEDTSGGFGRGGWLVPYADQEMGRIVEQDWVAKADAFVLGRTTYQSMYPYWSAVTDPQNRMATALNGLPKFVVSRSITEAAADWRDTTTIISGDLVEEIRRLKQRPARAHRRQAGSPKLPRAWRSRLRCVAVSTTRTVRPRPCCSSPRSAGSRGDPRMPRRG